MKWKSKRIAKNFAGKPESVVQKKPNFRFDFYKY